MLGTLRTGQTCSWATTAFAAIVHDDELQNKRAYTNICGTGLVAWELTLLYSHRHGSGATRPGPVLLTVQSSSPQFDERWVLV